MPVHDLIELLKRLHDEAEQVLHGKGTEREAREDDRVTEDIFARFHKSRPCRCSQAQAEIAGSR
jgi:hypothetical protein